MQSLLLGPRHDARLLLYESEGIRFDPPVACTGGDAIQSPLIQIQYRSALLVGVGGVTNEYR